MTKPEPAAPIKGRGTHYNPANRFFSTRSQTEDDGWLLEPKPGVLAH